MGVTKPKEDRVSGMGVYSFSSEAITELLAKLAVADH